MIRLHRGPEPEPLTRSKARRTARLTANPPPRDWATPAAKEMLRRALDSLTHGKCAFCESTLGLTSHAEIEHYQPKSICPHLAFEWENLFLACRLCNGAKRDTDHQGSLLKPDTEDPEQLLWLNLDSGKLEPRSGLTQDQQRRIQETIRICDLNRGALCKARLAMVRLTVNTLSRLSPEGAALTEESVGDLDALLTPAQPYKLAIRFLFEVSGNTAFAARDRQNFEAASAQ